jgi:hypothetical protein
VVLLFLSGEGSFVRTAPEVADALREEGEVYPERSLPVVTCSTFAAIAFAAKWAGAAWTSWLDGFLETWVLDSAPFLVHMWLAPRRVYPGVPVTGAHPLHLEVDKAGKVVGLCRQSCERLWHATQAAWSRLVGLQLPASLSEYLQKLLSLGVRDVSFFLQLALRLATVAEDNGTTRNEACP